MDNIEKLVRSRRSVRTFDDRAVDAETRAKLQAFIEKLDNPYGLTIEYRLLDAKEHKLSSPVVSGGELYVGGKMKRTEHMEEAFGYSFEQLVLYAQSLGLGTVWIGGTMDRGVFEKAMELGEGEVMPCVSPLAYPGKKMALRESMMRKGLKADDRRPFGELFFDGSLDVPLTAEKAGKLAFPLEMVRWAPSAVNKQPWRVIVTDKAAHFYLKKAKGFADGGAGNMQKIDMGIALCHFELAAKERGLTVSFALSDPGLETSADMEYIASYNI